MSEIAHDRPIYFSVGVLGWMMAPFLLWWRLHLKAQERQYRYASVKTEWREYEPGDEGYSLYSPSQGRWIIEG